MRKEEKGSSLLFLGVFINANLSVDLQLVNPYLLDLFIREENGPYLEQYEVDGVIFLGKTIDSYVTLQQCTFLEANVYSILKKLFPSFAIGENPLQILVKGEPLDSQKREFLLKTNTKEKANKKS